MKAGRKKSGLAAIGKLLVVLLTITAAALVYLLFQEDGED